MIRLDLGLDEDRGPVTAPPRPRPVAATPPAPPPGRDRREPPAIGDLFTVLVVSNPAPSSRRAKATLRASAITHVVVVAAVVLLPIFAPPPSPQQPDYIRALIYDPPPPPPPPLPKGTSPVPKLKPAEPVTPETKPEKPRLESPVSQPTDAELRKEARAQEIDQFGSPTGSDLGVPEGMEVGVEGGVVGGVPGGVLGGVIGGTGTGPVMDYDQPPRPLKTTRPQYPQEAFVKKIEGSVLVEILIDSTGRVARARVLQSIPLLDAAAIQCVHQWVFSPAIKNGRPVATIAHAPVSFKIF